MQLAPRLAALLVVVLVATPAAWADLRDDAAKALRKAPSKASVAVQLVALGDTPGESAGAPVVLFERNAEEAMIPASNLKLLTTAAALATLGEDFKFQTKLYVQPGEAEGEVQVAVVGGGDPGFGDSELLRDIDGWDTTTVFDRWAEVLIKAGVRKVTVLKLDDSLFEDLHDHPNWPTNQKHLWYEAQIGALNLNINCVDVHLSRAGGSHMNHRLDPPTSYIDIEGKTRVGKSNAVQLARHLGTNRVVLGGQTNARQQGPMKVTVDNPTAYFGHVFTESLQAAGITVDAIQIDRTVRASLAGGGADEWSEPSAWRLVAVHETPIATVLARTNKDSINLYAEALIKRLGAASGAVGSWESGEAAVKAYLAEAGVPTQVVALDDGSGMSRDNRVTAHAMVGVLAHQFESETFDTFLASLSEAGADGTLQRRFSTSGRGDLQGRVFGKTGYINGVSTMSGYLRGRDGAWYAFSVLVNNCPGGEIGKAKDLQEALVEALDESLVPATATAR